LMLTVLEGLADIERDLIRARTGEGRARAMALGVEMGRKPKLAPHQQKEAIKRRARGETLAEIGRSYNVSPATISRLSEDFKNITNWAPVVGIWDFENGRCVYKSPDETSGPHPYGICVSNVRYTAIARRPAAQGKSTALSACGTFATPDKPPLASWGPGALAGPHRCFPSRSW
jgi:hypothetical protein